jgi:hypothetical protein
MYSNAALTHPNTSTSAARRTSPALCTPAGPGRRSGAGVCVFSSLAVVGSVFSALVGSGVLELVRNMPSMPAVPTHALPLGALASRHVVPL